MLFYNAIYSQGISFSGFADPYIEIETRSLLPGDDIQSTCRSRSDQIRFNIEVGAATFHNSFTKQWNVEVQGIFREWHDDLEFYIRRTGDGDAERKGQPIKGGTVFQQVRSYPQHFFRCKGWRYQIPLQIEIRGYSLTLPAKEYALDLLFTISDR